MNPITLTEGNLTLREYTVEDAPVIFGLINQNRDHLSQYGDDTSDKYPDLESVVEGIINPKNPEKKRFGIWVDQTYVGTVNLIPSQLFSFAEIGYYLGKEFQGKQYMVRSVNLLTQYAFDSGIRELVGRVHRQNYQSRTTLFQAGYHVLDNNPQSEFVYYFRNQYTDKKQEVQEN